MDSKDSKSKELKLSPSPLQQLQVMAAMTTALGFGGTDLGISCRRRRPYSNLQRSTPGRNADGIAADMFFGDPSKSPPRTRTRRSIQVLASNSNRQIDSSDDTSSFKEDLSYLFKAGAGSFAGAAIIKYGSIVFPEITRPNILQALIMISTPVVVAVFLLIKQSQEAER